MDNQVLFDEILSNALDVLRLSATERAKVIQQLQDLGDAIVERIKQGNLGAQDKRNLEYFLEKANDLINEYYSKIGDNFALASIAEAVGQHTVTTLQTVLGSEAIANLPQTYLASVASDILIQGAPSAAWWQAQSDSLQFKFAQQMRMGMANGETNEQLVSRIAGKLGQPGVMDVAKNEARALVNTSVQTVANDARRKTFQENGDVVKGIEQISTLDSHTTLTCIAYSGNKWNLEYQPIGDSLPYNGGTPRHWNCRSVEVPLLKSFRDLGLPIDEMPEGTRASVDGQIAANTSFDDFLKRKGKEFQDEILGPGRAELWRDGKITLRDLVGGDGSPLTLAALRAKVGLD